MVKWDRILESKKWDKRNKWTKWDRILKMVMSSKINDTQFLHSKKGFSE